MSRSLLCFAIAIIAWLMAACGGEQSVLTPQRTPMAKVADPPTTEPTVTATPTPIPLAPTSSPTSVPTEALPLTATSIAPAPTPLPTLEPPVALAELEGTIGPIYSLAWSPDGKVIASAGFGQVKLWDAETHAEITALQGHTGAVWGVAWSPDGSTLASASTEGIVRLWNAGTFEELAMLDAEWPYCVAWSPDGKQVASGTATGNVQVWDVETGKQLYTLRGTPGIVIISLAWSPDGRTLAMGQWDGVLRVWDTETRTQREPLVATTTVRSDVNGLKWSPDGHILASAHQDGKIRLWDIESGEVLRTLEKHGGWARGVAWSPDGHLLASTGQDATVRVWDVETGRLLTAVGTASMPLWSVDWSPDSPHLAAGSGNYQVKNPGGTVFVWKVPVRTSMPADTAHSGPVRVLFIGNSLTFFNNLPEMFAELARSGGRMVDVDMSAQGGQTLFDHATSTQTLDKIQQQVWDFVILQEQSALPAIADDREEFMYPAVRLLAGEIRERGAEPLLFMTWGHRDGLPKVGLQDLEAMQEQLQAGYVDIAQELDAVVAPVGTAWQEAWVQDPQLDLWQPDGIHPSRQGSYLAACVFYAAIFQQSPEGLMYTADLPEKMAQFLQAIAAETVLEHPEHRNLSPPPGGGQTASVQAKDEGTTTVGLYSGNGAAEACATAAEKMFAWMGYAVDLIDDGTINRDNLHHLDVLYFPGGSSGPYQEEISSKGREKIREFVRSGGCFIGTCAGALFAAERVIWDGRIDPGDTLALFPGTVQGPIPEIYPDPEFGMCQVDLAKPHPITDTEPDSAWILYYNGPLFRPDSGAEVDVVGSYQLTNAPALVAFDYGQGRVFLTGPHPEWEEDSDRDGVSFFDRFDDRGSDWALMRNATRWCLHDLN